MKRIIYTLILFVFCAVGAASAQMRTAYFMEGSYFRTDLNPALAPTRGYIQMPGVGALGLSMNNNFLSVDNLFYKRDGQVVSFLNNAVSADDFLKKLPNTGKLSTNFSTNIIGFGAHTKKLFWNVGIGLRSHTEVAMKKDMFTALKNLGAGQYDMSGTYIGNTEYLETYVGFAIPIKEWVSIGFRVKGLLGVLDMAADINTMNAAITPDAVRAQFLGTIRANSFLFNGAYPAGAGLAADKLLRPDLNSMLSAIKSGGAAIDLGAEFRLLDDQLRVSASVTDLGFICWYKGSTINANSTGSFLYKGFNLASGDVEADGKFDAEMTPSQGAYTRRLSCALNAGVEYNILNNHIAFGLLSHTEFCNAFTTTELTASVNFRIGRWLSTSFSHTFLNRNVPGTFGWALNIHPAGFNFFVGADFIDVRFAKYDSVPVPKMLKSANLYVGLGFNLGRAKYMSCMKDVIARDEAKRAARKAKRDAKKGA